MDTTWPYPMPDSYGYLLVVSTFLQLGQRRHLPPLTSHRRTQVVHLGTAAAAELADNHLQVVNGSADDQQHNQIGYEKGAAAVLQGGERETPHVAQADGHGDARHQELDVVAPVAALRHRGRGCHRLRRRNGFGDLGAVLFWFSGLVKESGFEAFQNLIVII